ncbi:MAG: hypothetical protein IPI10_04940 [Bacteroidetes bacterium]|nr:hypothetical protein [Bacteroidota bacterium]
MNIQPMTSMEFYSYITPLSSIIKDGHSNIFPSEQITNSHNQTSSFFPFNIYWIEMFEKESLESGGTLGSQSCRFNGRQ